ncbi:MAG TPA: hypothetical protein VMV20_04975 [Chitinophagaceae bacterium]|nr:hypothetical protein [Chitinophagaceae bacterium]
MTTYTHDQTPVSTAAPEKHPSSGQKIEGILQELSLPDSEEVPARDILEKLARIRFSPRPETLREIQSRINQDHPVDR